MKKDTNGQKKFGISRRALVKWLMGLGATSMLAAMLSAANSLRPVKIGGEEEKQVKAGDRLVFAGGATKGKPITKDSLAYGETALAFPQGKESYEENLILLVKLDPQELQPPTRLDWTVEGLVAYSAICTHLGCTVWETLKANEIYCPCHAGVFDPRRGAIVVAGPPPRPLPQLPIRINAKGELEAAGPFEEPVGVL